MSLDLSEKIIHFLIEDQKLSFIYIDPETNKILNLQGSDQTFSILGIGQENISQYVSDLVPEMLGLEEFLYDAFSASQEGSELYSLNPVGKKINEQDYYFVFKVIKQDDQLVLIVSDITTTVKDFQSISQAYHENKLLREQLSATKDQMQDLLLNIFPEDVFNQLQDSGQYEPNQIEQATVLFTDFQGFSKTVATMEISNLIEELDQYFTQFDLIAERFHLEKIKTIGDSYMAVLGISPAKPIHPGYACLAGLEIQRFMKQLQELRFEPSHGVWPLRLGLHTGPVIAGVLGEKKSAYDIWGDTVNIASRMETSCEPGRVNISAQTYHLVKDLFECEYRGKLEVKNIGLVDMYYVLSIKPQFSVREQGIIPNEKFFKHISQPSSL